MPTKRFGPSAIAALQAALDGDQPMTIELEPGEYAIGPVALKRSITLVGTKGASETVLRPGGDHELLAVYEGQGETVLRGLTLRGGRAPGGGALIVDGNAKVAVELCAFEENTAGTIGGGAVHVGAQAAASFTRCVFRGNRAELGGALATTFEGRIALDRCFLSGNEAQVGGAIAARERATVTIASCTFVDNRARRTDGGGTLFLTGMKTRGPVVEMVNCLVTGERPLAHDPSRRGTLHLSSSVLPPNSVAPALAATTNGLFEVQADLVEVGGDLVALRAGAPGSDAADLSRVTKSAIDLLGRPLVQDGRADPGAIAGPRGAPGRVGEFTSMQS
ncbi:MAG: right-handed parallel beta-helix repeat-containing protein [Polyangiaceae bacterium]